MGRYTTVQTYADNNTKVGAITYENAAGAGILGGPSAPPLSAVGGVKVPKVINVSGSTAGAGSGDFHTYRKFRRIEELRVEAIEKEHRELVRGQEFRSRAAALAEAEEARLRKNAMKRKAKKLRRRATERLKKKIGDTQLDIGSDADETDSEDGDSEEGEEEEVKEKQVGGEASTKKAGIGGEEVSGTVVSLEVKKTSNEVGEWGGLKKVVEVTKEVPPSIPSIPSDGSFLSTFLASRKQQQLQ